MTALGKLLVFLNVALCLVLVTWAIGLYSQRVDWSSEGTGTNQQKGEVAKLRDKLQPRSGWGLLNELQAAESRFQSAAAGLGGMDKFKADNANWYVEKLKLLDTSKVPVQDLVYENGKLGLDAMGKPKLAPAKDAAGRDLNGYNFYVTQMGDTENQIKTTLATIEQLINKDAAIGEEIGGAKGIRYWLGVEKVKIDGVNEETEYLWPLLYNTVVEKELVLRRHKDLTARKVELEKSRLATR